MMYLLLVWQNVPTSGFWKCTYFWIFKMYLLLLYLILDCNMYLLLMYTILVFQNVPTSDVHNSAPPRRQPNNASTTRVRGRRRYNTGGQRKNAARRSWSAMSPTRVIFYAVLYPEAGVSRCWPTGPKERVHTTRDVTSPMAACSALPRPMRALSQCHTLGQRDQSVE